MEENPGHRRFQFSLRTLLIVTTVCAALFALLARWSYKAEKQRRAVEKLEMSGLVHCYYGNNTHNYFADDMGILGTRFMNWRFNISEVYFETPEVSDNDIETLKELDGLKRIAAHCEHESRLRAALPNCKFDGYGACNAEE
ncbi:MAG: hypothetical protein K8T25_14425 [Planctomycetia bacterium]|nr:hypothetical protein [Planctomycetia bacterium]